MISFCMILSNRDVKDSVLIKHGTTCMEQLFIKEKRKTFSFYDFKLLVPHIHSLIKLIPL